MLTRPGQDSMSEIRQSIVSSSARVGVIVP